MSAQVCSHGVQDDVPAELEQVRGAFDSLSEEASLEHVSRKVVTGVESHGVQAIDPVHPLGEIDLGRRDEQVGVVVHQAVRMTDPVMTRHRLA